MRNRDRPLREGDLTTLPRAIHALGLGQTLEAAGLRE
jgi:hypothetical protein